MSDDSGDNLEILMKFLKLIGNFLYIVLYTVFLFFSLRLWKQNIIKVSYRTVIFFETQRLQNFSILLSYN